jgi:histone H1/5
MGKGDIKTRRGKLFRGTYGKKRPGKIKKHSLISAGQARDTILSRKITKEPMRTKKPIQVVEQVVEEKVVEIKIPETITEEVVVDKKVTEKITEEVVVEEVKSEQEKKVELKTKAGKEKPVKKEEKPAKKEEKPAKKVEKPVKKEEKPAKREEKPAKKEVKKVKKEEKPTKKVEKPVKKEIKPKKETVKETKKPSTKSAGIKGAEVKKEGKSGAKKKASPKKK